MTVPLFVTIIILVLVAMRLRATTAVLARERKEFEAQRREAIIHRITAERADAGLVVQTLEGKVIWANDAYFKMMKRPPEQIIGFNPLSYAFAPEDRLSDAEIAKFRYDPKDFDSDSNVLRKNMRGDGAKIFLQINNSFYKPQEGPPLAVLVCRDVTNEIARENALRATSEKLAFTAAHDVLTGAANRGELARFMEQALGDRQGNSGQVGLYHIDLDKFKEVNDIHGHFAGDKVLVTVADRIRKRIRDSDLLARIGGDEFVVACPDLNDLSELKEIGDALIDVVAHPIPWRNTNLNCAVSIGAALSDATTQSADDLLLQSDFALYDVKRSGRGRLAIYTQDLSNRHMRETELADDLQVAVRDNALCFYFQPIIGTVSDSDRYIETLVRWNHHKQGMLPSEAFLPIAQSAGLMADIDYLAIEAALDLKMRLHAADLYGDRVTINVSPELLSDPKLVDRLCLAIDDRGLNRNDILLEIPEAMICQTSDGETAHVKVLNDLSAAGIRMVLDGFGSGQAGLLHFSKLKFWGVKIDKSLINNMLTNPAAKKVYSALVTLCRDLDLNVTSEGIETAALANQVTALGSHMMQGYWIARPMPADFIINWVSARSASAIAHSDHHRYLKAN